MSNQTFDPNVEPAIWLYRTTKQRRSKLGGLPNLPPWISWPRRKLTPEGVAAEFIGLGWSERASHLMAKVITPLGNVIYRKSRPPLHFVGQIDLSELPPLPLESGGPTLPTKGYLFFFANLSEDVPEDSLFSDNWTEHEEDDGSETRVIYARAAGPEREAPEGLPPLESRLVAKLYPNIAKEYPADDPVWCGVFPSHTIAAKRILTGGECPLPESLVVKRDRLKETLVERDWLASRLEVEIPATSLEWKDSARYPVALKESRHVIEGNEQVTSRKLHWVRHQMFGVAPTVRNEPGSTRHMTDRCGNPGIPLMTFDTDGGVHKKFQFCDGGILQFWIKPKDLAARRFDRCFATTEG
jgi:hypothetical protein